MSSDRAHEVLWEGRFLQLEVRGRWEFVTRNGISGVVGVVAVTQDQRVVLVEQHRPATQCRVIELPAGLAGDVKGAEHEPLVEAARRELMEETGYQAETWTQMATGFSSPGLTDESIVFFLAENLNKAGPGGGDESESIVVHEIALADVMSWLDQKLRTGLQIDLKLFAGLYLANYEIETRNERESKRTEANP